MYNIIPNAIPFYHPICFEKPERLAHSSWLMHTPFAMYLIDILRPNTLVELGTQYGVSYGAFCQAVKKLKLGTKCFAIDTWEGDEHTDLYDENVYFDFENYHRPRYSSFSKLIKSKFIDALPKFEDGSIDLLHIDGYHTYEAVSKNFKNWLPKMSDSGVILFHDTNFFNDNFGVWKLFREQKINYPNFEFLHGYGLGILGIGKNYPKQMDIFFNNQEGVHELQNFFHLLGRIVNSEYDIQNKLPSELDFQELRYIKEHKSSIEKIVYLWEEIIEINNNKGIFNVIFYIIKKFIAKK